MVRCIIFRLWLCGRLESTAWTLLLPDTLSNLQLYLYTHISDLKLRAVTLTSAAEPIEYDAQAGHGQDREWRRRAA
jgi:hypothetical protein